MVLDTEALQTRHSEKRHALVKATATGVLELKRLRGRLLELLLGHCNFYGLVSRESSSCFHAICTTALKPNGCGSSVATSSGVSVGSSLCC